MPFFACFMAVFIAFVSGSSDFSPVLSVKFWTSNINPA